MARKTRIDPGDIVKPGLPGRCTLLNIISRTPELDGRFQPEGTDKANLKAKPCGVVYLN